jgi:hypothetical protein
VIGKHRGSFQGCSSIRRSDGTLKGTRRSNKIHVRLENSGYAYLFPASPCCGTIGTPCDLTPEFRDESTNVELSIEVAAANI